VSALLRALFELRTQARAEMRVWSLSARKPSEPWRKKLCLIQAVSYRNQSHEIEHSIQRLQRRTQHPGSTTTFLKRYNSIGCPTTPYQT
jgi:hypothetical protein